MLSGLRDDYPIIRYPSHNRKHHTVYSLSGPGGRVVRHGSSKDRYAGSNPARVSTNEKLFDSCSISGWANSNTIIMYYGIC